MTHSVLLVGLGAIAMGYDLEMPASGMVLTHAKAFSQHPDFRLAGGVDADPARCALFETHYGAPAGTDLAGVLATTRPEVVVIAVPTAAHAGVLNAVLQHGTPRLILCEKPLSYDLAEANRMVAACREKNCLLYANYLRRVDPGVCEVKRRLDDGRIATPVKGVAWYTKGLLHNGSHFSNLLEFWLGPIDEFTPIKPGRLWDGSDPEPDVQMKFARGEMTFLAANEENFSHHEIHLVAPNGCLRYEQGGGNIRWQAAIPDPTAAGYTVLSRDAEAISSDGPRLLWHVADQISHVLAGKPSSLCTGDDALKTLDALTRVKAKL